MTDQKILLAFSPCPNDTFMFDALVNGKIETGGLQFEVSLDDIETLNQRAFRNEPDATKVSFAAFLNLTGQYQLLHSGSALGKGVGPLLIRLPGKNLDNKSRIAIPGEHTTASFLFSVFFPEMKNKVEMVFSEIENAVLSRQVDAGVIIHENRFTYEQKGLKKICDLGEQWEETTGQPIPLGGIIVKRSLPAETKQKIDRLVRRSVEFAFANPGSSSDYVKQHAQEMDEEVRKKHIALYVNEYSVDLGDSGRHAIETLFTLAQKNGIIHSIPKDIFVETIAELTN